MAPGPPEHHPVPNNVFPVTSPPLPPKPSPTVTSTAIVPGKISSFLSQLTNAAAGTTMANDDPSAKLSSRSRSVVPEQLRGGSASPTPFDKALPAPSTMMGTLPSSAWGGNEMVGLFPQQQATHAGATKSTATAAADQPQQCCYQHHQAESSPTWSDQSADNAAGVGNGWLGVLGPPPSLQDPPSWASTIADTSPRSEIQGSNNVNAVTDDLR
jgi:hypothetical protein